MIRVFSETSFGALVVGGLWYCFTPAGFDFFRAESASKSPTTLMTILILPVM